LIGDAANCSSIDSAARHLAGTVSEGDLNAARAPVLNGNVGPGTFGLSGTGLQQ